MTNAVNGKAGETRSVRRREYLLHTADAWVRTPMPGVRGGVAIVHASPALGADFLQYTAELAAGGSLEPVPTQRFVWVLEGELSVLLQVRGESGFSAGPRFDKRGFDKQGFDKQGFDQHGIDKQERKIFGAGEYAYLPEGFTGAVTAVSAAKAVVIEKRYDPLNGVHAPHAFVVHEEDAPPVALDGDPGLIVRSLLPGDISFDFAVNTMTYAAGAALGQVEIHVMEHGLVMLEGEGTYRLGDEGYGVTAGDFIWMAPYCPQWFMAEGGGPAKYLIYKDWNRRPRI